MSDDNYVLKPVKESVNFSTDDAYISVFNRDLNSGRGSVSISISSKKGTASIGFSTSERNHAEDLMTVLKPSSHNIDTVIRTPSEAFCVSNKVSDTGYKVEVSKLVVTSSGRSRTGLSILLTAEQVEAIYNILASSLGRAKLNKKEKGKR